MSNLSDTTLLDLLPENLKDDIECICFSKALSSIFPYALEATNKIRFFNFVDNLTSAELDNLAIELHVDVYSKNWTLEQKKETCVNALLWKLKKGTVFALKDFVKKVYGDIQVEEWFDYDGFPYHFRSRVCFFDQEVNLQSLNFLKDSLLKYKNARSRSDNIKVDFGSSYKLPMFHTAKIGVTYKILPIIQDNTEWNFFNWTEKNWFKL